MAARDAVRTALDENPELNYSDLERIAQKAYSEKTRHFIRLYRSSGKA
jgi:hypothetical protein